MTVTPRHAKDVEVPLRSRPPLETLREVCPGEWLRSQDDLARLLTDGGSDALRTFLASADPEIAAGDDTLSRFLTDAGVAIATTDDCSWDHAVRSGEDVQRLDARKALRLHAPTVVVCSWPPLGNSSNVREEPSLSGLIPRATSTEPSTCSDDKRRACRRRHRARAVRPRESRAATPPGVARGAGPGSPRRGVHLDAVRAPPVTAPP